MLHNLSRHVYPYSKQYGLGYNVYEDLYTQMAAGIPKVDNAEFQCIEMRAGSVLFMSRGMWHRTEATEESLSVSIIRRHPASFEYILGRLKQLLPRDPALRRRFTDPLSEMTGLARASRHCCKICPLAAEQTIRTVSLTTCCRSMSG